MTSKLIVAGFAAALALSACTSINPYTQQSQLSNTIEGRAARHRNGRPCGRRHRRRDRQRSARRCPDRRGRRRALGRRHRLVHGPAGAELRAQLQGTGVSVTRVGDQIILNMPSNITFDVDSATVQRQFNETLISVGLVLKKFNKTVVDVYGYTDSSGSDDYNEQLSQRRAVAVATVLAGQGVDQRRFFIEGRGEEDPIASNGTESGRAQNRRVEIQLSPIAQG